MVVYEDVRWRVVSQQRNDSALLIVNKVTNMAIHVVASPAGTYIQPRHGTIEVSTFDNQPAVKLT